MTALKKISSIYLKNPLNSFLLSVKIMFFKKILNDFSIEYLNSDFNLLIGIFLNLG